MTPEEQKKINSYKQLGLPDEQILRILKRDRVKQQVPQQQVPQSTPNYLSRVKDEFLAGGEMTVDAVQTGARILDEAPRGSLKRATGAVVAGAGSVVGSARTLFSPITAAITPAISAGAGKVMQGIDFLSETEIIKGFAETPESDAILDTIGGAIGKTKQWMKDNPDEAKALAYGAEAITLPIGVGAAKGATRGTISRLSQIERPNIKPLTEGFKNIRKQKLDKSIIPKEDLGESRSRTAELLQSGSKKNARGRVEEFSNPDKVATDFIAKTDKNAGTFQELVEQFDSGTKSIYKERDSLIKPFLTRKISSVDDYLGTIKDKVRDILRSGEQKTANLYNKILTKEIKLFNREAKQSSGGLATIKYLVERNKKLNQEVQKLYDDVGGKANLLPEDKIKVQVYEDLRKASKKYVDDIAGEKYANLGKEAAGMRQATEFLQTQRDRFKNAYSDIEWKNMNWKQRAAAVKEYLPYIGDIGKGRLTMLDTKSKVLGMAIEDQIRIIKKNYPKNRLKDSGQSQGL